MDIKSQVGTFSLCGLLAGTALMTGCVVADPPTVTTTRTVSTYEPGYVTTNLPAQYTVREYQGEPYYVAGDTYYRRTRSGYVVVNSPFAPATTVRTYNPGYVTTTLPSGYAVRRYRGADYYVVGNTWYRPHPRGYVVVNPPI